MKRLMLLLLAGNFLVCPVLKAAQIRGTFLLLQNTIFTTPFAPEYTKNLPAVIILLVILLTGCIYLLYISMRHKRLNRQIIDSMDVAVYLVNRKGDILRLFNSLGNSNETLCNIDNGYGSNLSQIVPDKEMYRLFRDLIKEVLQTRQTRQITTQMINVKGKKLFTTTRIVYYNKNHVLGFIRDISEIEHERIENERSRFFLESVLDNLPIATIVKDINDGGRYLIWNKKASEIVNVNSADIVGKRETDFNGRTQFVKEAEKYVIESGPQSFIKRTKNSNGEECVLSIHKALVSYEKGNERWMVSSSLDITEIEVQRKQIEAMNRHYLFVMKAIGLISWTWDLQKNEITCNRDFFTPKSEAAMGIVKEDGEDYFSQILPKFRDQMRQSFDDLRHDVISTMAAEYQIVYEGDNIPSWAETFAIVSLRDEKGKPTMLVGATRLIDERKKMEQELRDAMEKAEETNRLKSAFLANMSHEIRTPLNAIVGFSGILSESHPNEESREYARIIENNTQLLLQLINDILDISKIESGMLEFTYGEMDVNGSLSEVQAVSALKLSPEVSLSFNPVLENCLIHTEKNRVLQVINNYISNAIKYTESGEIKIGYYPPAEGMLRFYVRDTGSGIPKEKQDAIFQRFVKLDSFKQGTGLGLAICTMIAEKMNGHLGVISEVGKGSEFWFEIPYKPVLDA